MIKSKLIKVLTLSSFVFFITVFLLYRVGKLDGYLTNDSSSFQASPNGGAINSIYFDTIPNIDPSEKTILSSSKSVILIDKKIFFFDSINKKKPKIIYVDPNARLMMSGSKSGHIFSPWKPIDLSTITIYRSINIDSITYDTLTRKFIKRQ